jgi:hypothetical protein
VPLSLALVHATKFPGGKNANDNQHKLDPKFDVHLSTPLRMAVATQRRAAY